MIDAWLAYGVDREPGQGSRSGSWLIPGTVDSIRLAPALPPPGAPTSTLAVVAVVLSVAATFLVVRSGLGPDYQSEGTIVLLPPVARCRSRRRHGGRGEPLPVAAGNLDQAGDLVIRRMTSQVTAGRGCAKSKKPGVG